MNVVDDSIETLVEAAKMLEIRGLYQQDTNDSEEQSPDSSQDLAELKESTDNAIKNSHEPLIKVESRNETSQEQSSSFLPYSHDNNSNSPLKNAECEIKIESEPIESDPLETAANGDMFSINNLPPPSLQMNSNNMILPGNLVQGLPPGLSVNMNPLPLQQNNDKMTQNKPKKRKPLKKDPLIKEEEVNAILAKVQFQLNNMFIVHY